MSASLAVQYAIVAVVLLASVLAVFRKLAPKLAGRWQAAASIRLSRPQRAAWLRKIGRWLQPAQATGNCGDGCDTCGACGPKPPAAARRGDALPLEFKPRGK